MEKRGGLYLLHTVRFIKKTVGPALKLAVDVSNHQGALSNDVIEEWKRQGVAKVIARVSVEHQEYGAITLQQLQAALEAGLQVEGYLWLYWDEPMEAYVASAVELIKGMPVQRLWLDCECNDNLPEPEKVIERIRQAVAAAGPMPVGIYTSISWWTSATVNSDEFRNLLLWDASWGISDLDDFRPYGGWTKREMLQSEGNVPFGGVTVDKSIFRG